MAFFIEKLLAAMQNKDILKASLIIRDMGNQGYINERDHYGSTALMYACLSNSRICVELLLDLGASVHTKNRSKWDALICAIKTKNVELVKILIDRGAEINSISNPLIHAIMDEHVDLIKLLLSEGANIDAYDETGWTPLMYAVSRQYAQIVELLIDNGADLEFQNEDGHTALDIAKRKQNIDIHNTLEKAALATTL